MILAPLSKHRFLNMHGFPPLTLQEDMETVWSKWSRREERKKKDLPAAEGKAIKPKRKSCRE